MFGVWLLAIVALCQLHVFSYEQLTLDSLKKTCQFDTQRLSLDPEDDKNHFKHLNRTRTPGSAGSIYVQNYIIDHFNALNSQASYNWTIETDSFQAKGYNFTNIVAQKAPPGLEDPNFLVLAVHYDSLIKPEGFIGAIDSAVSCGILLDIAESVNKILDLAFDNEQTDQGLKIIFFDGEEAFEQWSATDSIYGARNLHKKWESEDKLRNIELFVLLDLLGATDINFVPSYFAATHDSYNDLSYVESRLKQHAPELFKGSSKFLAQQNDQFSREHNVYIEDDHIPFLRSGVPILHLIPDRFPSIWHRITDNFLNVDINAIKRWNLLLRVFTLEYLDIETI